MTNTSKLTAAAAVSGLVALAAPATADTILIGDLLFTDFERTTVTDTGEFDLNGDGFMDILFDVFDSDDQEIAFATGLESFNDGFYSKTHVFASNGFVTEFFEGDTVSSESYGSDLEDDRPMNGGALYADMLGMLGGTDDGSADRGYIGFEIETGPALEIINPCIDGVVSDDCIIRNDQVGLERVFQASTVSVVYGWLEVERGSVILGNSVVVGSGAPAVVGNLTPVPLPAGLPLLLAGLGAFGFVRSRKSKAA